MKKVKNVFKKLHKIIKSKKNIKIIRLFIILILISTTVFIGLKISKKDFKIDLNNNEISIYISGVSKIKLESKIKNNYFGQLDNIYSYSIHNSSKKLGSIEITERILDNDDYIIFIKSIKNKEIEDNYFVNLYFKNKYDSKIIADDITNKEFSSIVGYDKTTVPYLYFSNDNYGSIILSKIYKSNILEKKYGNEGFSTIRQLVSEENGWSKNSEYNYQITINNESELTETWLLFSKKQLLDTDYEIEKYIDMYIKSSGSTPWITRIGQYDKIAYSIDPFTREGYARNPGSNFGENEHKHYKETGARIYYDLFINKLISLYNMPRNNQGVWYTEYTSTYVSKDTNIFAPFVDTRHNENISKYLYNISKELNSKQLEKDSYMFLDYLVFKVKEGKILSIDKDLFLIPDYFSDFTDNVSHASLNHQLGMANLFLQSYYTTGKKDYYDVGISIIKTIEFQGNLWIRENGDLWYRMNTNFEFDSNDYKIVTLDDLLYLQDTLEIIGEKRSNIFDMFIASKYQYLLKINYSIPTGTINMLDKQGFIN